MVVDVRRHSNGRFLMIRCQQIRTADQRLFHSQKLKRWNSIILLIYADTVLCSCIHVLGGLSFLSSRFFIYYKNAVFYGEEERESTMSRRSG